MRRSFADGSNAGELAAVLDGFLVDAPAPWFSPQQLIDAVESGRIVTPIRKAPPRPEHDPDNITVIGALQDDMERIRHYMEELGGRRDSVGEFAAACLARGYAVEQEASTRAAVAAALRR